jgi:hypothetical protein
MSGYQRRQQWKLLYRRSDNGISMITFMEKIKREETTLILCVDEAGYKFGTLQFEDWLPRKKFYGSGESFVFTFKTGDDVKVYNGTGKNSMYQYMDKNCICVGGDTNQEGGRFAFYLGDDFYRGSSCSTRCYNNEVLSH